MTDPAYQVLLYYRYCAVPEAEAYALEHRDFCASLGLRGRILIGYEGINGTVSGLTAATRTYMAALENDPRFTGIEFKIDPAEGHVFRKLAVRFRPEIVTLGEEGLNPEVCTGKRLSPVEWLAALAEEDVVILDARNDFESALGKFKGAICPEVEHFRDFPGWIRENLGHLKDRKVLTYCTGGIRCEKLSGFLLREGFQDVSQLEGGIVNYSKHPETQGRDFEGLLYVFDQRIGVEANHTEGRRVISQCGNCGVTTTRYRNCMWSDCNRQYFQCETCEAAEGRFCGDACRVAEEARQTSAL